MANKIYIKAPGHTPVTVRIKWLANGKIQPLLYWTPDGSCYEIKRVYEMTPLAFLKDGGEGIRFKIKSEIEKPESYQDYHHVTLHETYLYFADGMFSGRNIVDERYSHENKEFIPVVLDVFPNGEYELISFEVRGTHYVVDKTIAIEPRASFNAGGAGVWHKVEARMVNGDVRMSVLYFEVNKWFVRVYPCVYIINTDFNNYTASALQDAL